MVCGIWGDSIALGIAMAHPGCNVSAKIGRPSNLILSHPLPTKHYDYVIISAGSNNPRDGGLRTQLEGIRDKVDADKVVWIVPLNSSRAAGIVRDVAAEHNDSVQMFNRSRDGVHPRSYTGLWALVKAKLGL
jgi:hypothetical protein